LFERNSSRKRVQPTLDSLRFDTSACQPIGEPEAGRTRMWVTPAGDGLGLYYFPMPPDLPVTQSVEELQTFFSRAMKGTGTILIETSVVALVGCRAARVILKMPQQPSGMKYVGSITLPFRDFSFVLKIQCQEKGTTGLREVVLLDRQLGPARGGAPAFDADSELFDAEFPDHPVARVRTELDHVCRTLVIDPSLARAPAFPLPTAPPNPALQPTPPSRRG